MCAFDNNQYEQEAHERWGATDAYREYQSRALLMPTDRVGRNDG